MSRMDVHTFPRLHAQACEVRTLLERRLAYSMVQAPEHVPSLKLKIKRAHALQTYTARLLDNLHDTSFWGMCRDHYHFLLLAVAMMRARIKVMPTGDADFSYLLHNDELPR